MAQKQSSKPALIVFGIPGDLASKKTIPALLELSNHGWDDVDIIGVGRSEWTDETLRQEFLNSIHKQRRFVPDDRPADAHAIRSHRVPRGSAYGLR